VSIIKVLFIDLAYIDRSIKIVFCNQDSCFNSYYVVWS